MGRTKYIDVMKGIGILTVVAGHVYSGLLRDLIFMFHMPLFFFIAGFLYKEGYAFKQLCLKKSLHLLIPYLTFLVILYPVELLLHYNPAQGLFIILIKPIVGGRALKGAVGVFWFVTCLFLVQITMQPLLSRLSTKFASTIMIAFLVISYLNSLLFPNFWLPFNANVIFAAAPFFFFGYIYKQKTFNVNFIFILLVAFGGGLLLFLGYENTYDMKYANYGIPFITFISSLSFILLFRITAKAISGFNAISAPLGVLGKSSMVIMFLHQPLQMALRESIIFGNPSIRFLLAVSGSFLVYAVASRFRFGRLFLTGSYKDFPFFQGTDAHLNRLMIV